MKYFRIGGVKKIFHRLVLSGQLMTKTECLLLYILVILISFEISFKGYNLYLNKTTAVPAAGGVYKELSVGEVKYANPIFAKTDVERSISHLVYSGLVRLDEKGDIAPDLAEKWEISPDGLAYKFSLKNGIYFHNGEQFSANDVVNTINAIKNPEIKSPYKDIWSEVAVSSLDSNSIELKIPRQSGPFIFNCTQGIVASNNLHSSVAETINGTGPYRLKNIKDMKGGYSYAELEAYNYYHNQPALIPRVEMYIYNDSISQEVKNNIADYTAVAGEAVNNDNFENMSFKVGRSLMLIPNLKNPTLADNANRAKIFKFEKLDSEQKFRLISLDAAKQKEKIEELREKYKDKNVDLDVKLLPAVDFYNQAQKRDFDLILYGSDYGPDRDPYAFWHSSQIGKNNFASYANKSLDIQLEDARMILDYNDRNKKYDEIFQRLINESMVIFFPAVKYPFEIKSNLGGAEKIIGDRPEDRFNTISSWYLKETRVRKQS